MEEIGKKWYLSKTLWVNIIGLLMMVFPPLKDILTPEVVAALFTVANVILRVKYTEDKLIK